MDVALLGARLLALETEFAFVMASDLPPRASAAPYTEAEVWAAVASVAPALEVAATRFAFAPVPPGAVLLDGAFNGAAALGPRVPAAEVDPSALPAAGAALWLGGEAASANNGANVLGSPSGVADMAGECAGGGGKWLFPAPGPAGAVGARPCRRRRPACAGALPGDRPFNIR